MKENLKIGKIELKNRLFLAPMLEITDLPYRLICRKAGVGMAYTEMIYIDSILHENEKTLKVMQTESKDSPLGIQITGNNVEDFKKVIPYLKKFDLVDLNCGCPSEKIIGNEAGAFLLNDPEKIEKIIKILKKAGLTVTVKIRLGFSKNEVLKISKIIENAGADAITLHARLAKHSYETPADWKWIKEVKKNVKIPVIGNGDVFKGADAKKILEIADGVMVGRGAIGDPLIFTRILNYLNSGTEERFDFKKNVKLFLEYLELCKKYGTEISQIKRLGAKFLKNVRGASKLREELMQLKKIEEIKRFFEKLL